MQASRALKIRGMKPEYIVITRYVSKPSISINARQMHFGRKIQVSKTHRFLEPNQIKKKKGAKEEDFYLTFKMKGMVTHTPPPMWHWIWTILSSCFHYYFSFLKKRESPKAASSRTTDGTPQPKAAEQVNQNDHPPRCRLLPSKLDHLYNLTQLYPDPDIFSR